MEVSVATNKHYEDINWLREWKGELKLRRWTTAYFDLVRYVPKSMEHSEYSRRVTEAVEAVPGARAGLLSMSRRYNGTHGSSKKYGCPAGKKWEMFRNFLLAMEDRHA